MMPNQNINVTDSIFWASNLKVLETRAPELAGRLKNASSDFCQMLPAKNGQPTLFYLEPQKKAAYLHSPQDPLSEAKKMISGLDFNGEDMTVLLGFGLGYLPLEISKKMHPEHRLVVVEASLEILAAACRSVDLTALFNNPRIDIFLPDQLSSIWRVVEKEVFKILGGSVAKLIHPPSFELFQSSYTQVETEIEAFIRAHQDNFNALENHRALLLKNILGNLLAVAQAAPIDALFKKAAGRPALVVAAGPSLDKNIALIKKVGQNFWVLAVDTALKPLLAAGIYPDLVVAVDPNQINYTKFDGIKPHVFKQIPIVFSPLLFPDIPPLFKNRFVFGEPHCFGQWALSLRPPAAELPYAFTVAQHAFYLARQMGADPIVYAGLDLAFAPDGDHAQNSAIKWEIDPNAADLPRVPGLNGQLVPTCGGFIHMITLFEREIATTAATCIDATEGGALIRGTKVMTLKEVISRFAKPFNDNATAAEITSDRTDYSRFTGGLKWLLKEAMAMQSDSVSALSLHKRLAGVSPKDPQNRDEIAAILADINRVADRIDGRKQFLAVIKDFMGAVMIDQYKSRFQLERENDPGEKQKLQTQSSYIFLDRLKEIVDGIILHSRQVLTAVSGHEKDI
jgi:hypothetical protein